jgi:hypothetical protein
MVEKGIDRDEEDMKRAGKRRFISLGRFAGIELATLAIMLVIVAAVAVCGPPGVKADGRRGLASALFAALRGSNSLLYVK